MPGCRQLLFLVLIFVMHNSCYVIALYQFIAIYLTWVVVWSSSNLFNLVLITAFRKEGISWDCCQTLNSMHIFLFSVLCHPVQLPFHLFLSENKSILHEKWKKKRHNYCVSKICQMIIVFLCVSVDTWSSTCLSVPLSYYKEAVSVVICLYLLFKTWGFWLHVFFLHNYI